MASDGHITKCSSRRTAYFTNPITLGKDVYKQNRMENQSVVSGSRLPPFKSSSEPSYSTCLKPRFPPLQMSVRRPSVCKRVVKDEL